MDSIVTESAIDPNDLRRALGHFVTGVTVVTTRDVDGAFAGLTVNSFSSLSLSPPLVLWSLALSAASFQAFAHCSHFMVNVLSEDQIQIAERFAQSGGDKFKDLPLRESVAGIPLLHEVAANFACRITARHPGGDHIILIGEVMAFEKSDRAPLLYARGRYCGLGNVKSK